MDVAQPGSMQRNKLQLPIQQKGAGRLRVKKQFERHKRLNKTNQDAFNDHRGREPHNTEISTLA